MSGTATEGSDPSLPPKLRLAGAGALVGLAGLVASLATASLLRERLSPVTAMAEAIIDITPGQVAKILVDVTQRYDKPLLIAGTVLGILGLSAVAGLLSRGGLGRAYLVFLAMAGLGMAAALTRPQATSISALPIVVGGVVWIGALSVMLGGRDGVEGNRAVLEDRRIFLRRTSLLGLATIAVALAGQLWGRERRQVEETRRDLTLDITAGAVAADTAVGVAGIAAWRTPNADFYRIDTAVVVPAVRPEEWSLRIHGMVEREVVVTYDDLLAREVTEAWVTLCCVSNEVGGDLVGNAWWSGVRIADLLAEAGPLPGADAVHQTSQDGWTCGTPLTALTDERNALLALGMNGEPLPIEHGFPVRMVVPGLYGFVSATKWVVDLEVTRFADFDAFWTVRGWAEQCQLRTQSRIDVPRRFRRVMSGEVAVGGIAFAQHTGIAAVEVRLDGGPWQQMELGGVPNDDTWVQWGGRITAEPGTHTLWVRATDKSGYTQESIRRDVVPDGATGWDQVEFTAE